MSLWSDTLLVLILLTNLLLLVSSRMGGLVKTVALQGAILGLLPLLSRLHGVTVHLAVLAVVTVFVKGMLFPVMLNRIVKGLRVRREVKPYVGPTWSLTAGVLAMAVAFWLGSRLTVPGHVLSPLALPAALATIFAGFFIIITRKKAVIQVLGYLVAENGIFAFGAALAQEGPVLVELAMLLDVLVAVFIMGIAIHHINDEFENIDMDRLSLLKD